MAKQNYKTTQKFPQTIRNYHKVSDYLARNISAKGADLDKTAPLGAVWSRFALFAPSTELTV